MKKILNINKKLSLLTFLLSWNYGNICLFFKFIVILNKENNKVNAIFKEELRIYY